MNKGKIRTRRLTIRAKILIPSIIIVVLVCGLMGYNSYTRFEKSMVRMGVEEADMAATIVADSLDAKLVYKVTVGSEGTQVYQNLQGDLRKSKKHAGLLFYTHCIRTERKCIMVWIRTRMRQKSVMNLRIHTRNWSRCSVERNTFRIHRPYRRRRSDYGIQAY